MDAISKRKKEGKKERKKEKKKERKKEKRIVILSDSIRPKMG